MSESFIPTPTFSDDSLDTGNPGQATCQQPQTWRSKSLYGRGIDMLSLTSTMRSLGNLPGGRDASGCRGRQEEKDMYGRPKAKWGKTVSGGHMSERKAGRICLR